MTDFIQMLVEMRNGKVAIDLNNKFKELLDAVLNTAHKGELNLKITVSPSKLALGGAVIEVETEHETKMKKPELHVGKSIFFVNKDGELQRDDPEQQAMFAKENEYNERKPQ